LGRAVFRNLLSLLVADFVTRILGVVVTVYLGRTLGDEGFGVLNFAIAVASYFLMPVNFGFNEYGVLNVSPDRSTENVRRHIGDLFGLRGLISVVAFSALVVATFLVPRFEAVRPLILFSGTLLFAHAFSVEWVFTALERMTYIAVARIGSSLLYFGLLFVMVTSADDLLTAAGLQAGRQVLLSVLLLALCAVRIARPAFSLRPGSWREIGVFVLPIGLSSALSQAHSNIDVVILGFSVGDDALGWYAAAIHLIGAARMIKMAMGQVILPRLAARRGHPDDMNALAERLQRYATTLGIMIGVGGSTLGVELIDASYGVEYEGAALPLQIAIWTVFFELLGLVVTNILFIRNRYRFAALYGVSLAVNVVANFTLIPWLGIVGSAIAFVLSNGLWVVLVWRAVRLDGFNVPLLHGMREAVPAGLAMGAVALSLRGFGFWFAGGAASAAFVLVLVAMGMTPARIKADLRGR
jgi:O-antigen/teichoic acid export membrane protein